jgi:hypothetical protein
VIPPRAEADDSVVPGSTLDFHLRGFRVPCLVISPFAPARVVHSGPYDHASVLKLVEWRFGLEPVAARDAAANNLAEVLDLTSPARTDAPDIPVLVGQPRLPCGPQSFAGPRPAGTPAQASAPSGGGAAPPPTTAAPTPTTTGTRGTGTLARTGLDLPVEAVGAGFLLGAWGLYHLRRTGQEGPLPLRPAVDDADDQIARSTPSQ